MPHERRAGLTIVELLVVLLILAAVITVAVPSIAGAKGNSGVQQSMANIANLGVAHVLYALDWDMRQVTWVKDDLGAFGGNPTAYNVAAGCFSGSCWPCPEQCQPPMVAGWDCNGVGPYAYWPNLSGIMLQPMHFPDTPNTCGICATAGTFRVPNSKPLQDYINGRYHDPVYYAPNDTSVSHLQQSCSTTACMFSAEADCNPGWSSYAMSPAAMFHHDVLRSVGAGGWQPPWTIGPGYQGPGFFQGTYPELKTCMLEHAWVQGPPAPCNPAHAPCEPYYFNQGIGSSPVTLFYDISVRLLPNTEAYDADQQVLKQNDGVDGLWHRGTSLGTGGYQIAASYDGTPLSHHILTIDGILGRDTLAEALPAAVDPKRPLVAQVHPFAPAPPGSILPPERSLIRFTPPVAADQ